MPDPVLCLSTCPDAETAARIARALVEARLAACVNLLPAMRSIYRWQGAIEDAGEVQLIIKTTRGRLPRLREQLRALHPHEVPELVEVAIEGGLPEYLAWIAAETMP